MITFIPEKLNMEQLHKLFFPEICPDYTHTSRVVCLSVTYFIFFRDKIELLPGAVRHRNNPFRAKNRSVPVRLR